MDGIDRSLSIKLYNVMDQVGVSERIRKLHKDRAITTEIVQNIRIRMSADPINTSYIFGSRFEGSTTVGLHSDIDYLGCNEHEPVIDDIHSAPHGVSYLIIRDSHTFPGYVKLQRVENGTPMTIYNAKISCHHLHTDTSCQQLVTDTEGRFCKKHSRLINSDDDDIIERHGPADAFPTDGPIIAHDFVYALRCRTIPTCARKWLDRRRRYHWPSNENLKQMSDYGCFVVGVGHSSSREPHIEWRLSFSLQERLLMFSLNPTQHKCYVLFKMIKNDIIKEEIGECISSYHCKTCLFYTIENTPASIWRRDNLVCCVRLCLMILLTWVVNGVCPNFHVPSENMFEKPQFRAKRNRLIKLLRVLIADDSSIMLRLHCDDISNRILQPGYLHKNMTDTLVYKTYVDFLTP